MVAALVGFGVHTSQSPDGAEGLPTAATSPVELTATPDVDPVQLPTAEPSSAPEHGTGSERMGTAVPPPPPGDDTGTSTEGRSAEGDSAGSAVDSGIVVDVEKLPTGDPTTLSAGGDTVTVAAVSGTGSLELGFQRTSSSAAPNLPTYVSAICDGRSVYSGAFNVTTAGPVVQDVPFSGPSCVIKVKIAQPSTNWTGTSSAVTVTEGEPTTLDSGNPVTVEAGWTTIAVHSSDTFTLDVPDGFTGVVSVKMTACSSRGGTSDESRQFACGDLVEKDVGSSGRITITDADDTVAETAFDISPETHHDMISLDVADVDGDLTLRIDHAGGSAVLVHGPGTSAVGAS